MPRPLNVHDLPVFGPSDILPMLPEDELQALADDIRENGLRHPVVVGDVGRR